jgi:hypothetical protein
MGALPQQVLVLERLSLCPLLEGYGQIRMCIEQCKGKKKEESIRKGGESAPSSFLLTASYGCSFYVLAPFLYVFFHKMGCKSLKTVCLGYSKLKPLFLNLVLHGIIFFKLSNLVHNC